MRKPRFRPDMDAWAARTIAEHDRDPRGFVERRIAKYGEGSGQRIAKQVMESARRIGYVCANLHEGRICGQRVKGHDPTCPRCGGRVK